jgi:hypothetical protein
MVNRYTVRISVLERKGANGPGGIFGQTMQDKLLDASFTTDEIESIRTQVDGLLFEGIPETQHRAEVSRVLPPTVMDSGDLDGVSLLSPGGRHSGDCKCKSCTEECADEWHINDAEMPQCPTCGDTLAGDDEPNTFRIG